MSNVPESKSELANLLGEDLSVKQWNAIHMLVYSTKSKYEIAKELGISEPTIYNWLARVDFQTQISIQTKFRINTINEELATVYIEFLRSIYESQREVLQKGSFEQKLQLLRVLMEKFDFSIMPQAKLQERELPNPEEISEFVHRMSVKRKELEEKEGKSE